MNLFSLARAVLGTPGAQNGSLFPTRLVRAAHWFCALIGLLALGSTALAQVEPALPGSVEYQLTSNNYSWVLTSDPIGVGVYVDDLISDYRLNQPAGRGAIGIVTETGWDPDYNQMAALVDFGRDYTTGIVFSELSAVQLIAVPEPSSLVLLLFGALFARAVLSRPGRAKANS